MSPAITVRCRVRGCSCLVLTVGELDELINAPKCNGCGGTGEIRESGYPVAMCGACHGWGRLTTEPRWLREQRQEEEWREAIDAPLGVGSDD